MTGWLLVSGDFVPTGGMDMANLGLARYLAQSHRVQLVTHRADPSLMNLTHVTLDLVARPWGKHIIGERLLARRGVQQAKKKVSDDWRIVVNGGNCIWPGVNWVHYVHAAYPAPQPKSFLRRCKRWLTHGQETRNEKIALTQATHVICNSRRTAKDVVEKVGIAADKVRVVYYGTDPERFPAITQTDRQLARQQLGWSDQPWALYIGSLGDTRKGFDTLFASWKSMCKELTWDVNLAVVGRGAELPVWQAEAVNSGLSKRIHFLGFRTDVPTILAAADVLIHPARYEAYGLGVHEALCRGLPAIVTADTGVAERYPSELQDLLLTDPDDSMELRERLLHWRKSLDGWPRRMESLANQLRNQTWNDMGAAFVAAAS